MILNMSSTAAFSAFAPLLAALAFVATVLVWPTWRGWRRTGVFPVVFTRKSGAGLQRLVGAAMGLLVLGFLAAFGWRAWAGPWGEWSASPQLVALGWTLVAAGWLLIVVAQRQLAASWREALEARAAR